MRELQPERLNAVARMIFLARVRPGPVPGVGIGRGTS